MNIDERLQYLAQSTESLHANIERLYETVAENDVQIKQLIKATSIDAENIRALAAIAQAKGF